MTALIGMYESVAAWLYSAKEQQKSWLKSEKGQTTIEYILVIVLIALVLVFAFQSSAIENAINTAVNKIADAINSAPAIPTP